MALSIKHQFYFSQSSNMVWAYLTNAELLQLWLMKNDFQPIVGYEFTFNTKPKPDLHFDGIFYCKVLEIIPFKTLSYSWKGGPGDGIITLDTVVHWTLVEEAKGTRLLLEHTGFDEVKNLVLQAGMTEGWVKHVQKIIDHLNAAPHGTTNV